ncbi:hypothetical protein E4U07_04990 [Bifidobacterium dentium]|uniref:hypothetical protein n=1 Tax=Bifidobacterium dentium TaxID=1689 RepID=UPI0010769402|nr:hypothetical protein [Bifidobacterium dentium]TFZ22290.1 hypothetical protein E4U07_04990 [Bifidobacterium dentium]
MRNISIDLGDLLIKIATVALIGFIVWLSIALPPSKKIIVHSDYGDFSCAYAQYPNGNDVLRYCYKIEDTK